MELPDLYLIIRTKKCTGELIPDKIIVNNVERVLEDLQKYRNDNIWSTAYQECFIFKKNCPIEYFKFYKTQQFNSLDYLNKILQYEIQLSF